MEEDISTWRKTGHFYFALTDKHSAGHTAAGHHSKSFFALLSSLRRTNTFTPPLTTPNKGRWPPQSSASTMASMPWASSAERASSASTRFE